MTTTPLATSDDVEASLGRPLTAEDEARCEKLLLLASRAVLNLTGFRFAPDDYLITRRPVGGKVTIPATVATVTSVTAIDSCSGAETALVLDVDYTRRGRVLYGLCYREVEIAFTTTDPVPDEIVALVAGIVASTIAGPPVGAASEGSGPFTISYVNSSGRVYLAASDKQVLAPWIQPRAAVELL